MLPYSIIKVFFLATVLCGSGLRSLPEENTVIPSVIIGGGVGGSTAAIYLSRAGFKPVVIDGAHPGGALVESNLVENWPGIMKVPGTELMDRIREQAIANGATYRREEVLSVDFKKRPFTILTRSLDEPHTLKTIRAASCVIATGSTPNFLGVKGEQEYWGRGVSNCAICDGSLYRGKRVAIVGGGDSAVLEALYLANMAKEVTLFVRKDHFKATDEKRKAALLALPNVKLFYHTTVEEITGDGSSLTKVKIRQEKGEREFPLDGLFLAIGSTPNTTLFQDQLELDSQGYIALKEGQQTSIPGVYAVGDVVDPIYKQAISAAGDGAKAALAIQTDLSAKAPELLSAYRSSLEKPQQRAAQIIEITSRAQFEEELNAMNSLPILVDFYATWCPPCKRITPRLESSAAQLEGKVRFFKVNVDRFGDLIAQYEIRAMPTVLVFNQDGQVVERRVGENQIDELLAKLEKN